MTPSRVAVGGILAECNHFGGLPMDICTFEQCELLRGEQMLGVRTSVVGGMLSALRSDDMMAIPLIFASACAAGPITQACYQQLKRELLTRLSDELPVDGVLLPLHGSALVDGTDDPEGDLIRSVRGLIGSEHPIVVTLDLHANVTSEMVSDCDALLAWETYPHCDQYLTGRRAAHLLKRVIRGECKPTMAMAKVPVITSAVNGSTEGNDPFADLMSTTKSLETKPEVLSTSLFLIHPYMDVAGMGSGGCVVTDNNIELAVDLATGIAEQYWKRRHDLEPVTHPPQDAIAKGLSIQGGPVILVETADCCGGGAAGDSIATLSALVDGAVEESSLVPVVDPEAAAACHSAGEGARLTLELGHKLDPKWGKTRSFDVTVETLGSGEFKYVGGQWHDRDETMGPTAVVSLGGIRILITSRATYDWADEQFKSVGLRPAQAKFVVAKNPMNYRLAYGNLAKAVFILDTPGPTPATLLNARFKKLRRPYFPADSIIPDLRPTVLR